MSDYEVPVGWKFYGSNNGNQTIFIRDGHSAVAPRLAIFDRKPAVNDGRGSLTNPRYTVRVINGFTDSDGNPISDRAVMEATIRWPNHADVSVIKGMIGVLGTMLTNASLQNDIVDEMLLPRSVSSE